MNATSDLKSDHITVRRLGIIVQNCSDKLYLNEDIPIEDLELISVIIEEFVDRFHHGKEEQAYFPETKDKDNFGEDIRKFLIEHELGRRIARMLRRHLNSWKKGIDSREPVARFLKSYAVFISDHTGKEDKFFDLVEEFWGKWYFMYPWQFRDPICLLLFVNYSNQLIDTNVFMQKHYRKK